MVAGVHKELIAEARMRAHKFGDSTTIGSLLDELADALEAAETTADVECYTAVFGWVNCPQPDTCGNPGRTVRRLVRP